MHDSQLNLPRRLLEYRLLSAAVLHAQFVDCPGVIHLELFPQKAEDSQ